MGRGPKELSVLSIPSRDGSVDAFEANADAPIGATRRTVLARAGSLGIATLTFPGFLAACGGGNQDKTKSDAKTTGAPATRGGTLTLAVDGTNGIADPAFYTTLGDWMAVDCICRGLTFIDFHTTPASRSRTSLSAGRFPTTGSSTASSCAKASSSTTPRR
jgi:hypothetical protein